MQSIKPENGKRTKKRCEKKSNKFVPFRISGDSHSYIPHLTKLKDLSQCVSMYSKYSLQLMSLNSDCYHHHSSISLTRRPLHLISQKVSRKKKKTEERRNDQRPTFYNNNVRVVVVNNFFYDISWRDSMHRHTHTTLHTQYTVHTRPLACVRTLSHRSTWRWVIPFQIS